MLGTIADLLGVLIIALGITCGAVIGVGFWNGTK